MAARWTLLQVSAEQGKIDLVAIWSRVACRQRRRAICSGALGKCKVVVSRHALCHRCHPHNYVMFPLLLMLLVVVLKAANRLGYCRRRLTCPCWLHRPARQAARANSRLQSACGRQRTGTACDRRGRSSVAGSICTILVRPEDGGTVRRPDKRATRAPPMRRCMYRHYTMPFSETASCSACALYHSARWGEYLHRELR